MKKKKDVLKLYLGTKSIHYIVFSICLKYYKIKMFKRSGNEGLGVDEDSERQRT